jgi:PadR family transcriptional regulator PadR
VNTQYKKGVLELCVLSLLKHHDRYGYEISEYLSGHIDIADGTVYPILRKLKSDGLVTTYLSEESGGPPRKYYSLTKLGRETYDADRREYLIFAKTVEALLEEEDYDEK